MFVYKPQIKGKAKKGYGISMYTQKLLKELTSEIGISGYEYDFSRTVKKILDKYCEKTIIEKSGNVKGFLTPFDKTKKTVLLEAHLDRIGLVVSEVLDNGFLKFRTMGGVDERILPASEVYVLGREVCFGVIGEIPPHIKGNSDSLNQAPKISDMLIDTGLSTEEVSKKISVGDPILLRSQFLELEDGKISSAALDNRAGMTAIFECLELIKGKTAPVNVCVAFTIGEEMGLLGARTLDFELEPDLAVIVDVTHGKTHDSKSLGTFELGTGPIICRGPNLHYEKTNKIIDLAQKTEIPFDVEVAPDNTGTNAWALQTMEMGIPCALVSIPLRYMHTTVETVCTDDIKNTARLLSEIVSGGDKIA